MQQIASSSAYALLARLIDLGSLPPSTPVKMTARDDFTGLEVTITICSYEPYVPGKMKPSPIMKRILNVLAGQPARKANWIASKLGKRHGADGGLRQTLSTMVKGGLLKKGDDRFGYLVAPQLPATDPAPGRLDLLILRL